MQVNRWDIIIGSSVIAIALAGLFLIIPQGVSIPGGIDLSALSPDFWPKIVMYGLVIAGGIILFQGFVPKAEQQEGEIQESLSWDVATVKLVICILTIFLYYFAISYLGIVISSVVVLLGLMLLGGERRAKLLLPVAMLLPILLYYFFTHVANVPLPLGLFES